MKSPRAYLDHNASAPLLPEARAAMIAALDLTANPSSVHHEGREARRIVEAARRDVAALCNAKPEHVVFTSGASEAAALVLTPLMMHRRRVSRQVQSRDHGRPRFRQQRRACVMIQIGSRRLHAALGSLVLGSVAGQRISLKLQGRPSYLPASQAEENSVHQF